MWLLWVIATAFVSTTLAQYSIAAYKDVVVFGDSLCDNGNGVKQLYDSSFPLPPYFDFQFCNGPVWISNIPARDIRDYAYGGAVVNQSASNNGPPSLMAQINDYLIYNHFDLARIAPYTQYIFWGGSNDIIDSLSNQSLTAQGVLAPTAQVAAELPLLIASQIQKLVTAGALDILVISLPPLANAPAQSSIFSTSQLTLLSQLTTTLNQGIQTAISAINATDVRIKFFDAVQFINTILANPAAYGLVNVVDPCFSNYEAFITGEGGETPIVCPNPDQFLFWDGEHPTTRIQAYFAQQILQFLGW